MKFILVVQAITSLGMLGIIYALNKKLHAEYKKSREYIKLWNSAGAAYAQNTRILEGLLEINRRLEKQNKQLKNILKIILSSRSSRLLDSHKSLDMKAIRDIFKELDN